MSQRTQYDASELCREQAMAIPANHFGHGLQFVQQIQ